MEADEMDEDVIENMDIDEALEGHAIIALTTPLLRSGHIALKYKNRMLVWGGYQDSNPDTQYLPTTTVCFYDFVSEKWHFQHTGDTNAPPGTGSACGLIYADKLYVFGGYCEGNTNEIYSLDLDSFEWEKCECSGTKPLACDKMVGWVHEGRLYFFGGFGKPPRHPDIPKTMFCQFSVEENYAEGPPPVPRAAHAAAKIGSKVYIFGGRHKSVRMNDLHYLDLETMTWSGRLTMKGTLPQGRSWHSFTPISEDLVVLFGGFSQQEEALSDCWMLNVATLSWSRAQLSCNKARLWHTACVGDQGEVVIFGGCGGNGLNPRALNTDEHILTLWFSPKSLLRLSLDAIVIHKQILEPVWHTLPLALQEVLRLKSSNDIMEQKEN